MTEYVVFYSEKGEGDWTQLAGYREARSATSAIRNYLENGADDLTQGYFAAVPRRSFRPVTVKVETKTALKFS